MLIHPQLSHQCMPVCVCVFVFTAVSVFSDTLPCVFCVCCVNTAQWLVCEVGDSFIMACAHRETAPSRGRREEDGDAGQARFTVGPAHVSPAVGGGRGVGGTAAVSFNEPSLLSSAFNLQGCPALLHCPSFPPTHTSL